MLLNLAEIKAKVEELNEKIGASAASLPTYGYSEGFAHPHISRWIHAATTTSSSSAVKNRNATRPTLLTNFFTLFSRT